MWPPSIKLKMLIAIAILPLLLDTKQTSAQAVTEPADGMPTTATRKTYGLGGYIMNDKDHVVVPQDALLLNTTEDVKKYKKNDHADKQFKPCKVELDKDNNIEVFYDEETANNGCTVDFVMDKIDEITTHIKVADKKMGCLEDCGDNEMAASSKNMVPFTYSQSNDEFKKLHSGPPYNEDQSSCKEKKPKCVEKGSKCMASATSLQLGWTKCAIGRREGWYTIIRAGAWIQLVGDPVSEWSAEIKDKSGENPDEAVFELSIGMGYNPKFPMNKVPLFDVAGPEGIADRFLYKKHANGQIIFPVCFLNDRLAMIPVPQFWTINSGNAQINGKHLLVFHLLPQKATRIFNEEGILQNKKPPAPGMPKCKGKLSIIFLNAVGLLQSATSSGTTSNMTATSGTKTDAPSNSKLVKVGIVVGTIVVLIIVAFLLCCFCCKNEEKDKNDEDAEERTGSGGHVNKGKDEPVEVDIEQISPAGRVGMM